MISSLLHLVGLRPRVYYTLTNFRGGGEGPLAPLLNTPMTYGAMVGAPAKAHILDHLDVSQRQPTINMFCPNNANSMSLTSFPYLIVGDFLLLSIRLCFAVNLS